MIAEVIATTVIKALINSIADVVESEYNDLDSDTMKKSITENLEHFNDEKAFDLLDEIVDGVNRRL
ncbi:MAG TPA: hypothetical protein DEP37_06695 [Algoriphagus sp.]|nr:hypothetical protein [Algoriphagus sp.]|tara:strand:+ start:251 stop:448 length:198 start_codon:yes stop_codon:yes gene_type:complete